MNRLFFIISILALVFSMDVEAQEVYKTFDNDTVQGDTNMYPLGRKIKDYAGIVAFQFTKTDVADSLNKAVIQGSMNNTNWTDLTGTAVLSETSTDGTTVLYVTTPKYLWYRGFLSAASADTVAITNPVTIYKD